MADTSSRNSSRRIAEALGRVVRRRVRAPLYADLTANLDAAVNPATYPVVSAIDRLGPSSAAALADEVGRERSGVCRRAATRGAAGLLASGPDPADARAVLLDLTDRGREAVVTMRERLDRAVDAATDEWTDEEVETFARLFTRFVDGLGR